MKFIIPLLAASVANAVWVRRSDRALFSSIAIESITDQANEGNLSLGIAGAMRTYIEANGIADSQGNVPDDWVQWFKTQTGEVQCQDDGNGNCQAGFMDLTPLHGYGCWCFFGNINTAYGRGPPIDSYDAVCKGLTQCYRCIIHDSDNEEDEECDPYNQEFESVLTVSGSFGIQNITSICQSNNVPNCAWRTCSCAMTMVSGFFNLSFDALSDYDENLKHSNGFDYNLECPQQGRATDRQCCGKYPNRRTYDRGEARDCCLESTIYNPLRHQCCDDGSRVGLGGRC